MTRKKSLIRKSAFTVLWEFQVRPGHQRAFEKAYGPDGDWVRLFRRGDGYLGTELVPDPETPLRYRTLDSWISRQKLRLFKAQNLAAYRVLDCRCARLTEREQFVGEFHSLVEARKRAHDFRTGAAVAFRIRPAIESDISAMLALETSSPSAAHWLESAYRSIFSSNTPKRVALVAEGQNGSLQGFVVAGFTGEECELENIVVARQRQHRGLGTELIRALTAAARSQNASCVLLEVRTSNAAARALYQRNGFVLSGSRKSYYSNPLEDAAVYSLRL